MSWPHCGGISCFWKGMWKICGGRVFQNKRRPKSWWKESALEMKEPLRPGLKGTEWLWKDGQVSKKQALHLTWLGRVRPPQGWRERCHDLGVTKPNFENPLQKDFIGGSQPREHNQNLSQNTPKTRTCSRKQGPHLQSPCLRAHRYIPYSTIFKV